jgi:hypothetical protein
VTGLSYRSAVPVKNTAAAVNSSRRSTSTVPQASAGSKKEAAQEKWQERLSRLQQLAGSDLTEEASKRL